MTGQEVDWSFSGQTRVVGLQWKRYRTFGFRTTLGKFLKQMRNYQLLNKKEVRLAYVKPAAQTKSKSRYSQSQVYRQPLVARYLFRCVYWCLPIELQTIWIAVQWRHDADQNRVCDLLSRSDPFLLPVSVLNNDVVPDRTTTKNENLERVMRLSNIKGKRTCQGTRESRTMARNSVKYIKLEQGVCKKKSQL
jgi:hypothetical protein